MRQYERLTNNIKPDLERYEKVKAEVTDVQEFFPAASTEIAPLKQHYPKAVLIDKLADDVKKQWVFLSVGWPSLLFPSYSPSFRASKREQYHRRRMFDPEAPIDYINERNRRFNSKLDRFYSKYTGDIKEDLERGTAL